jgi:hypothetical protein
MGDAEPVGFELPALARLDGHARVRELDPVRAEGQVGGYVAARVHGLLEPRDLRAAEERVADAQRDRAQRQARRHAQDLLVGLDAQLAADRLLDVRAADVERLDGHVGWPRIQEHAREAAGAGVELRLRDERAAALDADDLAVVVEDRERLAHDHSADPEPARQFGL